MRSNCAAPPQREEPLDPKLVALLLGAAAVVIAAGAVLVRYGQRQRQRGWTLGGWAVILFWGGSIVFVLVRYALEPR